MLQKILSKCRVTTWLMIIGFTISLTSVLEGIGIINSVLYASRAATNYAFTSQLQVTLTGSIDGGWDMETLLSGTQGVTTSEGIMMYLDSVPDVAGCSWTVLLSNNGEHLKQPLKWGQLPGLDSYEIAIPDTFEEYAEKKNNELFLKVQGIDYRVVGVFDTAQSAEAGLFLIGYRSLPEAIYTELFEEETFSFTIKSDLVNTYEQIEIIKQNIEVNDIPALISAREVDIETPILLTMENTGLSLSFSIYLFSIANCLVVTNYWIITKRQDMAIRKAFGWSNKNLMTYITAEMGGILVVSLLLSALALGLLAVWSPEQFAFTITPLFLLGTIGLLLITLCIAVAIPFYRILKIKPAEVIG